MRPNTAAEKPLILVIEDEEAINENICEILEHSGYRVLSALDGAQGFEMIRRHAPDIVLCDIMMPVMDGVELLFQLRSQAQFLPLPFIFLTAKSQAEDILTGLKTGADDYLPKPFETKELLRAVEFRLLKHRQLLDESREEGKRKYLELAGRTSHELGNYLNGLLNGVEILLDDVNNMMLDDVEMLSTMIKKAGNDLYVRFHNLEIVHGMQVGAYFSRVDRSSTSLFSPDYLRALVAEVCKPYSNRIPDVTWEVTTDSLAICDEHLWKLLFEIVLNAIHFSKEGDEVRILGEVVDDAYQISVIDNGVGVDVSKIDYSNLFRESVSDEPHQFGMGLGLYISSNILSFWGGTMNLFSEPGAGALVIVRLPRAQAASGE